MFVLPLSLRAVYSALHLGQNVRWPLRVLTPGESLRDRERETDSRPMHYAYHCYKVGHRNKVNRPISEAGMARE